MSLSKKEIYKGVVTKSFFIKHILYLLLMVLMVLFMKLLIFDIVNGEKTSLEILLMIVKCIILDVNLR